MPFAGVVAVAVVVNSFFLLQKFVVYHFESYFVLISVFVLLSIFVCLNVCCNCSQRVIIKMVF